MMYMTKAEFIDEVNSIDALIDFCCDNNLEDMVENIFDEYSYNEIMNSYVRELARTEDWETVRSRISNFPAGYDWYIENGYGDFDPFCDDDFEDLKREVCSAAERDSIFEEELEEEEPEDNPDSVDFESSLSALLAS